MSGLSLSLLIVLLLPVAAFAEGKKKTLLAIVKNVYYYDHYIDVVAIDPISGNASVLYSLPPAVYSDIKQCIYPIPERNVIYMWTADKDGNGNHLYEISLSDGHLIDSYDQNKNSSWNVYSQWDFDPDTMTVYGLCLNVTQNSNYFNYTWCSAKIDKNGSQNTQHGFYVCTDEYVPHSGPCGRVPMNRHTFKTGEYWYSLGNYIFVRRINSSSGDPGDIIWTIEDKQDFDALQYAAFVTGVVNEYAIVVRAPLMNEGMAVVRLDSSGNEQVIAQLPAALIPNGPGGVLWGYDPSDNTLYILMATYWEYICDTLVVVNLTEPTNSGSSSFHTIPVLLKDIFDPENYFVTELHFVEWPSTSES